ncbi:hypothetical protein BH23ACT9_BH23ACT9_01460 [soil metagenome]
MLVVVIALMAAACGQGTATVTGVGTAADQSPAAPTDDQAPDPTADAPTDAPGDQSATFDQAMPAGERLVVREVARRPHDRTAFTQGFVFHEGRLFESRGLYANQEPVTLTEIDPLDGSAIRSLPRDPADGNYFAEGLTVVGDRLVQLTWQDNVAFVYDLETFERVGTFTYEGEGWGLCTEPDRLVMSNGTSTLTTRDRDSFAVIDSVTVTLDGQPQDNLNELACVGGLVWANVWQTPTILVIDPDTGRVVSVVDASSLATANGRFAEDPSADVLNGIAFDEQTGTWLLTGKLWPFMFEVEFDCTAGCVEDLSHYVRPRTPPLAARS